MKQQKIKNLKKNKKRKTKKWHTTELWNNFKRPNVHVIKVPDSAHQDGGIDRYTLSPHITKRRVTNLKTKNNQNCQKIEPYESPTTQELKKKLSSRLGGGVETGSWVERTHSLSLIHI